MAYEVFDSKSVRIGSPALTIQEDGKLALNADVGDILKSMGAKYVQILWDREACRLALRPLNRKDQRAFKLSFPSAKRGATISARSFLKYIQWQWMGALTIEVHWNDKDGLLEAMLPPDRVGIALADRDRK